MTCQNDDDDHNMFKVGVWTKTREGQGKEGGRKRHCVCGWCMPSVNLKIFLLVNELCAWGQGYFLLFYALTCILFTNSSKGFIHVSFHCKYC